MKTTHSSTQSREEDIIITLPANALEALGMPLDTQLDWGYSTAENSSSFMASAAGRDQPFPCFKKNFGGERFLVKIIPNDLKPYAA